MLRQNGFGTVRKKVLLVLLLVGASIFWMSFFGGGAQAPSRTESAALSIVPPPADAAPYLHGWQDRTVLTLRGLPDGETTPAGMTGTDAAVDNPPVQSLQVAGQVMPPVQASAAAATIAVPVPAGSNRHRLTIVSRPPGARILVDGTYTGKVTPFTMDDLPGNDHTIRLEMCDYTPYEEKISLVADINRTVDLYSPYPCVRNRALSAPVFPAESNSGGIYLDTIPHMNTGKGADSDSDDRVSAITIDSVAIEQSLPLVIMGLQEGLHRVSIQEQDNTVGTRSYEVWVFSDTVVPLLIDRNRVSPPVTVNISISGYRGTDFTTNGLSPVYSMPRSVSVETSQIGCPFITVRKENAYLSLPVTSFDGFDIPAASLPASPGSVTVDSDPQGAEIFVDGFRTGFYTPFTVRNLSAGSHRIMVSHGGYIPDDAIVTVYPDLPVHVEHFLLREYSYGTLEVEGPLDGGEILINKMRTGEKSPHTFYGMPIGAYAVSVRAQNRTLYTQDIVLEPDNDNVCTVP